LLTWAVWDDVNGVLTFMTDADTVENARQNKAMLGGEFCRELPPDPTPEEACAYVNELWAGDPGGRGWQLPVPAGATWLVLRDDEEAGAADGPEPTFGFGEPPLAMALAGAGVLMRRRGAKASRCPIADSSSP
jgi:hypothetical protein